MTQSLPGPKVQATILSSVWDIFRIHDSESSGHLSQEQFAEAIRTCQALLPPDTEILVVEDAWKHSGGAQTGFVNFPQFCSWVEQLGLGLPIGLKHADARSEEEFVGNGRSLRPADWTFGQDGLVQLTDPDLLAALQEMLDSTHKASDNWTRDRGCALHGVNNCVDACVFRNREPVPSSYTLVAAYRNQNIGLWNRYNQFKHTMVERCATKSDIEYKHLLVASAVDLQDPLDQRCNEWRLFHGSSIAACRSICASNFQLGYSGAGATWKKVGEDRGVPLYGHGIYFGERITKADEYALPAPAGCSEAGLHCVVVSRVVGGRCREVTESQLEVDELRKDVFQRPYDSILGDRMSSLGKPYREVVVYEQDQCFPEYMLVYARQYS